MTAGLNAERARRARAARRARIVRIRKAVATLSVVVFIALFSTIYVQMATGHDPTLGTGAAATSTTAKANTAGSAISEDDSASSTDLPDTGFSGTGAAVDPGSSLTPMTTSQS